MLEAKKATHRVANAPRERTNPIAGSFWHQLMPWSSVRGLVVTGFVLLVMILALVTAAAAWQSSRHQADLRDLEFHSTRASLIQNVETQASIAGLLLQRYVDAGGDNYPDEINQHAVAAQVSLEAVVNLGDAPPGFEEVTSVGLQLMQDAARAAELRRIGEVDAARDVLEELVPIFRDYRLTLEELTAQEFDEVSALRASSNQAGQLTFWLLVTSGVLGVIFGLGVSFFIMRSISRPLGSLEATAIQVSGGNLHARSNVTGPRELAQLGGTMNTMVATIQQRTEELEERNRQLLDARALASTDGLTGVLNHRAFQEQIRGEVEKAASTGSAVSLIMLDLDSFKQINDQLGHQKGDEVLRSCTNCCARVAGGNSVYRYGGDEIAILLPGEPIERAVAIAERVRTAVMAEEMAGGILTVSLGVTSYPATAKSAEGLTYQADSAMYAAKSAGKNRICRWDEITAGTSTQDTDDAAASPSDQEQPTTSR